MNWLRKMLPSRRWLFLPPVLIGVAVIAVLAQSKRELERVPVSARAVPLEVIRVSRQPVYPQAIGYGTAQPRRTWTAVAEVDGRVVWTRANLRPGVAVKSGETLLRIDTSDYELRVRQRESEQKQAQASLERLKLNRIADEKSLKIQQDLLEVRQREVDRMADLRQRSAASQSEIDGARAALLLQAQTIQTLQNSLSTYDSQLASAQAEIDSADARLREARLDVQRTEVVAPFDGLLSGVDLEEGQVVTPNQTLFQVIDAEWIEIEAQFSFAQFRRLIQPGGKEPAKQPSDPNGESTGRNRTRSMADSFREVVTESVASLGLTAEVSVRSGDTLLRFPGQPVRFSEALDSQTRTLGVVVSFRNQNRQESNRLWPGSYAEVVLSGSEPVMGYLVPRNAVENESIFLVDANQSVRRRRVTTAFQLDEQTVIVEGIATGDRVVANPPAMLSEGMLISPIAISGDEWLSEARSR